MRDPLSGPHGQPTAPEAVTFSKIAPGAVTQSRIGDSQIVTAKLADLAVTTGKLADSAVTSAKIGSNQVTFSEIAAATIIEANLNAAVLSSSWAQVSYGSGWSASGAGLWYKRIGNELHISGSAARSGGGLTVFNALPSTFRPASNWPVQVLLIDGASRQHEWVTVATMGTGVVRSTSDPPGRDDAHQRDATSTRTPTRTSRSTRGSGRDLTSPTGQFVPNALLTVG